MSADSIHSDEASSAHVYDHPKAMAFQTAVVHLAEVNGLNVLELRGALGPIIAVCDSIIKTGLEDSARADGVNAAYRKVKPEGDPKRAGLTIV